MSAVRARLTRWAGMSHSHFSGPIGPQSGTLPLWVGTERTQCGAVTNEGALQPGDFDITRTFVRVLDERPDGFVEFRFSIGDPSLYVEMFLPRAAFEEFCSVNAVQLLDRDHPVGLDVDPFADADGWNWSMHDARHHSIARTDPTATD